MEKATRRQKLSPTTGMAPEAEGGVVSSNGRRKTETPWFKKKMEALSLHFKPVVFPPPGKHLDIGAHEGLLTRLGLWDFVNLDFGEAIREDLIKELVLCYFHNPKTHDRRSRVNRTQININRTALGNALRLPLKRDGGAFLVSKEEGLFLEKFIWEFMVLRDESEDASLMSHPYMSGFAEAVREMRLESADWAGLVWFMVEREVLRGRDLAKCYYASHLQLLLKHQRPEWFAGVGVGLESGQKTQTQSILTKCGKRKRDDDEGERLRKLDLGGDDQAMEGGNLDALCQRDMVNSNANILSSDCDISLTQPGYSESPTYNLSESAIETSEPKDSTVGLDRQEIENQQKKVDIIENQYELEHKFKSATEMNGDSIADVAADKMDCQEVDLNFKEDKAGRESMTFEANIGDSFTVPCRGRDEPVEDEETETAFEANASNSLIVHCRNEDDVMLDEAIVVCEANTLISHEVHPEKDNDLNEKEKNDAEFEANIGKSVNVHCEKRDDVLPLKEQEAAFEANDGNSLDVCGLKEDVMEDKENEANNCDLLTEKVNTAQECGQPELEFMNEAEKNREAEFSGYGMERQEVYTGKEVGSIASVGWLVTQGGHDEGVENVDITENQYKAELVFNEMNGADFSLDEMDFDFNCVADNTAREVEPVASVGLFVTQDDKVVKKDNGSNSQELENQPVQMGSCLENSGSEFILEISDDVEMDRGGAELCLMQSNKEGDATGTLVNQAREGSISNDKEQKLHTIPPVPIDVLSESSDDEGFQNAFGHLERGEGNGMNGITGRSVSVGQLSLETDMAGFNIGMTAQYGHGEVTDNRIGIGTSNKHVGKSMDIDHCAENVKNWVARLKNSVKGTVEESHNSSVMLQKEQQENRHYELTLLKERQEKQTRDHRFERELSMLNSVVQDYKKSIEQVNTSFAKYRKHSQLRDGGGRVVSASEREQEQQNKSLIAIEAMLGNFEEQWKSTLEDQLGTLGVYNDRLGDLEHAVNAMKP